MKLAHDSRHPHRDPQAPDLRGEGSGLRSDRPGPRAWAPIRRPPPRPPRPSRSPRCAWVSSPRRRRSSPRPLPRALPRRRQPPPILASRCGKRSSPWRFSPAHGPARGLSPMAVPSRRTSPLRRRPRRSPSSTTTTCRQPVPRPRGPGLRRQGPAARRHLLRQLRRPAQVHLARLERPETDLDRRHLRRPTARDAALRLPARRARPARGDLGGQEGRHGLDRGARPPSAPARSSDARAQASFLRALARRPWRE